MHLFYAPTAEKALHDGGGVYRGSGAYVQRRHRRGRRWAGRCTVQYGLGDPAPGWRTSKNGGTLR